MNSHNMVPFRLGFGVTYEGLKLGLHFLDCVPYVGFGVTYEGLKQVLREVFGRRSRGFGVTYEGLKPS